MFPTCSRLVSDTSILIPRLEALDISATTYITYWRDSVATKEGRYGLVKATHKRRCPLTKDRHGCYWIRQRDNCICADIAMFDAGIVCHNCQTTSPLNGSDADVNENTRLVDMQLANTNIRGRKPRLYCSRGAVVSWKLTIKTCGDRSLR